MLFLQYTVINLVLTKSSGPKHHAVLLTTPIFASYRLTVVNGPTGYEYDICLESTCSLCASFVIRVGFILDRFSLGRQWKSDEAERNGGFSTACSVQHYADFTSTWKHIQYSKPSLFALCKSIFLFWNKLLPAGIWPLSTHSNSAKYFESIWQKLSTNLFYSKPK